MNNGEVKCPVHGTHGNLSHGRCWFCVQTGNTTTAVAGKTRKIGFSETVNQSTRVPGTVRVIK